MARAIEKIIIAGMTAGALLATVNAASAGAFAVREQSAEGLGEAFAGVAAGAGGLSSMFWNPATMTQQDGWRSSWVFSGIVPYANISPSALTAGTINAVTGGLGATGGSGDISRSVVVPTSFTTYQVNDWLWIGNTINAPFGLTTKANFAWAGQVYGRTSDVRSANIQPNVAIKLNDMVSFGVGVQIVYFDTKLTSAAPFILGNSASALLINAPSADLRGNSWGYGVTAGATLRPFQGTEIGIGYRSQVKEDLSGTLVNPLLPGSFGIKTSLTLPDQATIGLRQRITDDVSMLAEFEWTHWGVFGSFPVYATNQPALFFPPIGAQVTTLAFRYRDGWFASLGGEYKWNPNLTLRAGLAYEESPISDTVRNVRLPDSNRIWTTIGLSYRYNNRLSFDVSYAHIFPQAANVTLGPGSPAFYNPIANPTAPTLPFQGHVSSHVDIVSVGVNWRWDDPKVIAEAPQAPIVRKD